MAQTIQTQMLYRGRPEQLAVLLQDAAGVRLPTCGVTSVSAVLKNEDNSLIEKAAAAGSSWGYGNPLFVYSFNFTAVETALLKVGTNQSVWIKLTFASTVLTFKLDGIFSVSNELI